VEDLSHLLKPDPVSALVPTSQHGGNQVADNSNAMTAPGGASGDLGNDLGTAVVVNPPKVETQSKTQPGDDGMPQAAGENWSPPGAPSWKSAPAHSN